MLNGSENEMDTTLSKTAPFSIFENIEDPELLISTKDMIDTITCMDSAIDVVGVVNNITSPYSVTDKTNKQYQILKFSLQCKDCEVPIVAWDEDVKRIIHYVKLDAILHIDGPYARHQDPKYSANNKDYILTIRSNTHINTLAKVKMAPPQSVPEFYSIKNCININTIIALKVIVKVEFKSSIENPCKGDGVITDGVEKINVTIYNYGGNNMQFEKGENVKLIGKFVERSQHLMFVVSDMKNIIKLQGDKLSVKDLRKITKVARRMNSDTLQNNFKKPKI